MASIMLALGDDACMKTIGSLAERMADAIAEGRSVRIDITDAVNADLSVVQLIEAARRHGDAIGCELSLTAPAPAAMEALLVRAGFMSAPTPSDVAFWFHGEYPR